MDTGANVLGEILKAGSDDELEVPPGQEPSTAIVAAFQVASLRDPQDKSVCGELEAKPLCSPRHSDSEDNDQRYHLRPMPPITFDEIQHKSKKSDSHIPRKLPHKIPK